MTWRKLMMRALVATVLSTAARCAFAQSTQNTTYSYQYDAQGNLTQIIDPLGHVTNQSYDTLNRLKQQLQPAPTSIAARPVINYTYDGLDQLISVTDPRNLVTSYTIDGLGNRTVIASPDSGTVSSTYDDAGNMLTSIDAKGQTTSYSYDAINRVTHIAYADGSSIDYSYDQGNYGIGRLTRIVDTSGTTQYTYDQKGRVLTETRTIDGVSWAIGYGYDSAGRLASITYPSGRVVAYTRDATGRISRIDVSKDGTTQTLVSQVVYWPFGGVQSFVNGTGQTISRSVDLDGRITSYSLHGQPQLVSYDAASRITSIWDTTNAANVSNYGYDNLDRLTQVSGMGPGQSFVYDASGNRISQLLGNSSTVYNINPNSNRLTQVNSSTTSQTYAYDANGSIVNNGAVQFNYDARGRLVSANTALGLVQYKINALGQRVQKISPDGSTVYHYDQSSKLIGENNGQGAKEYVYLNDIPVAVLAQ